MYKALYISPMIPSYDMAATGEFFHELFGFEKVFDSGNYAIYEKNHLTIHILPAGQDIGQMEFYIEVDDVDIIWESIKNKIDGINVRAPFDQTYKMREIHIEIPHTNTLLFIGQSIDG
jgi:hypothetical protein